MSDVIFHDQNQSDPTLKDQKYESKMSYNRESTGRWYLQNIFVLKNVKEAEWYFDENSKCYKDKYLGSFHTITYSASENWYL